MQRCALWSQLFQSCSKSVQEAKPSRTNFWLVSVRSFSQNITAEVFTPQLWNPTYSFCSCSRTLSEMSFKKAPKKGFVLNKERQTEETVIHPLLQKAWPPCFVEQKLIGAVEGSEAWVGPIDCAINAQTEGINTEIQNTVRRLHREFCNAFHSTKRNPEGAVMTGVIGFLQLW